MGVTRTYIGPLDAIETVLLDGHTVAVERGEDLEDLSAEDAERLDAQPSNWAKTTTRAAKAAKDGD